MPTTRDVVLREGSATPKNVVLYALPVPSISSTTIFMYAGNSTPNNIVLSDPAKVRQVSGGTNYTLAVGVGAFSMSGVDVGLRAGRRLTVGAGTFSFSGLDVGLRATRVLPVGAGTFSLSGQNAGLLAGRKMVVGAGSFSLTGQDAGLLAGRKIAADVGTFTFTGLPVTLTYTEFGSGDAVERLPIDVRFPSQVRIDAVLPNTTMLLSVSSGPLIQANWTP